MANRHAGRLAEVGKHLVLSAVLAGERPDRYGETHAGQAASPLVADAERRLGFVHFREGAVGVAELAGSRYAAHLDALGVRMPATPVPGSALLAMCELGQTASYVLCDTDPSSTADLARAAALLGLLDRCEVVEADGSDAVAERFLGRDPSGALVHVDPLEPFAASPRGLSALDVALELAEAGVGLMYWYGYGPSGGSRLGAGRPRRPHPGQALGRATSSWSVQMDACTTPVTSAAAPLPASGARWTWSSRRKCAAAGHDVRLHALGLFLVGVGWRLLHSNTCS